MKSWSSNPVITLLIGFLLALLAEPLKQRIQRILQSREARRRVYDDLGAYLSRVEALSLLERLDVLLWNEVIRPQAPNFDYYTEHEPGVLLRADKNRGAYKLVERLRSLASEYGKRNPILPEGGTDNSLSGSLLGDVLDRYRVLLRDGSLDRRLLVEAGKKRRQPIAQRCPPLLT